MTNDERKIFWNTLCSLEGKDFSNEYKSLIKTISYPNFLYRFRAVTPKTLDALRTNKQFLSSAQYFDDPFDAFIHIDKSKIKEVITFFKDKENILVFMNTIMDALKNTVPSESQTQSILNNIDTQERASEVQDTIDREGLQSVQEKIIKFIDTANNEVRKCIWALCFTENWNNETLWIKYADQHHGFVVEYDFTEVKNGTAFDNIPEESALILPSYYSEERYNASTFSQRILLESQLRPLIPKDLFTPILNALPSCMWEIIKISLIKNKCHEHDKEWRLLLPKASIQGYPVELAPPSSITLGLRLKGAERELTVHCAQQAGIKNIYEVYINNESMLDRRTI